MKQGKRGRQNGKAKKGPADRVDNAVRETFVEAGREAEPQPAAGVAGRLDRLIENERKASRTGPAKGKRRA